MKPGDVVLVKFPFANLHEAKKRPALILRQGEVSPKSKLVTIAMITSKMDGLKLDGDVRIESWEKAKLLHPSLIRLSKIATLDLELIERRLGALSEGDLKEVRRVFKRLFAHWLS